LSHSSEHNLISNTAFLSILTGFIATILFWPRLLRLIRTYKSEFRRLKKEKKKGKKMTAGEWLLLVIAILLAGLCAIALCIGLLCKDCNDTAQDPNSDCWSSSSSSQGSSSSDNQC